MSSSKEKEWADRAKRFLKGKLKHADVTYEELAERLKQEGLDETVPSIASKLSRGTFSAVFFLAVLAAINVEKIEIKDL